MDQKINDGGPAFPVLVQEHNDGSVQLLGMTLRDYFAAKAMSAWISTYSAEVETGQAVKAVHMVAHYAYAMADAMLRARTKA